MMDAVTPSASLQAARAAKPAAAELFGRLADVVGVGITRVGEGYGVKVNLREAPASHVELPEAIEGVPVKVEVVGSIRRQRA
jgi:hypothetical protein